MCRDEYPPYDEITEQPSGHEAYAVVAEELDVPPEAIKSTLAMLDPKVVELAKAYAKRAHKAWPPHATRSGWTVTTQHIDW